MFEKVICPSDAFCNTAAQTTDAKKQFKRAFNTSKNFIKHADKDPKASLAFNTETNILILYDCAWIITLHIDEECVYSQTVIACCAFVYPDLFDPERIKQIRNSIKVTFDLHDFDAIAADLKLHYHAQQITGHRFNSPGKS